jgi:Flp pilus assembly pilin Flp
MDKELSAIKRLFLDESGGEVLEYALVAGLIVIGALSLVGQIGAKVLAKWTSLNSKM